MENEPKIMPGFLESKVITDLQKDVEDLKITVAICVCGMIFLCLMLGVIIWKLL